MEAGEEREREKIEEKELANPNTIPIFTWPLLGIGRPEILPGKLLLLLLLWLFTVMMFLPAPAISILFRSLGYVIWPLTKKKKEKRNCSPEFGVWTLNGEEEGDLVKWGCLPLRTDGPVFDVCLYRTTDSEIPLLWAIITRSVLLADSLVTGASSWRFWPWPGITYERNWNALLAAVSSHLPRVNSFLEAHIQYNVWLTHFIDLGKNLSSCIYESEFYN